MDISSQPFDPNKITEGSKCCPFCVEGLLRATDIGYAIPNTTLYKCDVCANSLYIVNPIIVNTTPLSNKGEGLLLISEAIEKIQCYQSNIIYNRYVITFDDLQSIGDMLLKAKSKLMKI